MLTDVDHRPWALPERRWIMAQTWRDLLFAHWPIPVDVLRAKVPEPLALDLFEGQAWLGIVPFRMTGVRMRGTPALPWLSAFPELNVRTYVTVGSKPGVYFFSLEAANPVAVRAARAWFGLPYYHARMSLEDDGATIRYRSRRTHRGAEPADFAASYGPVGAVERTVPGSLEHWLTERYCLYTVDRRGRIHRGEVHHDPWPLQRAEWDVETNGMAAAHGITLPDVAPLCHFARRLDVVVWNPRRVESG